MGQGSSAASPLGLIQTLGAFLAYFIVYAEEGFTPSALLNLRVAWEQDFVNDLEDNYGQQWVRTGSVNALSRLTERLCFPGQP